MWGNSKRQLVRPVRLLGVGLTALVAVTVGFVSPAAALADIILPVETVTYGEEGDVIQVATTAVDPEFVGVPCIARLIDTNNESVHPNNDLIITSGEWTETVPDVESKADSTQIIDEEILLGETVVVEIRLGPDGVSSGGVTLTFRCDDLPPEPPCTDADGNPIVPNDDGTCPSPSPCTDADGNPVTPNDDGTCPSPAPCGSDGDGDAIAPNDDGTCGETGDIPTADPPCTDADGNNVNPDNEGNCPAPPPEGPIDCGTNADGTPVAPVDDETCPTPPPPLQPPPPTPTADPVLPVTGVESSLLLGLTGVFILAAGWAMVLRPGAPSLVTGSALNGRGTSSSRS